MNVAVVAEKPSVARDIARVLKATQQGQGFPYSNTAFPSHTVATMAHQM